ncbi:MAG: TonB-dependent receptor, partial [Candidatus Omnitrophica bacterium]|nr:TonB-dependent receptor [Candidatus Omnitrophota bacterium]
MAKFKVFLCGFILLSLVLGDVFAQGGFVEEEELMLFYEMPIVTSAARREQQLGDITNPMTVISREEIERSGATQLGDLFYRVPGVQTERCDGQNYAVSIRGNPRVFTDDILVLVDNVVSFNPVANATAWGALPVALDDIERVEIIRGPGGILYSSNAVSGVINIITKSAKTEENYVKMRSGTNSYAMGSLGMGLKPFESKDFYARLSYQYDESDGFGRGSTGSGTSSRDNLDRHKVSLNLEYDLNEDISIKTTMKQDHHETWKFGMSSAPTLKRVNESNHFALTYNQTISEDYNFDVLFAIFNQNMSMLATSDVDVNSFNLRSQHNYTWGDHLFSFGAEWAYTKENVAANIMTNQHQTQTISSWFAQDEYRPNDQWILTAGTRFDNNSTVPNKNYLLSPRISAIYKPFENHTFRGSFSRVYKTPTAAER